MRPVLLIPLLLILTVACSDDGAPGDGASAPMPPIPTPPAADDTPGAPTAAPPSPTEGASPRDAPDELVRCESDAGFALGRPASWHTDDAAGSGGCTQLHPEPFEPPGPTDERVAAITAYIDPVPFHEVAAPDPDRKAERAVTTIDGFQAVRLSWDATGDAFWPAGTPITLYAVDLAPGVGDGPGTLFLDTVGLESFDYDRNRVVLDRVARSIEVTLDGVQRNPDVVARYEGGGGGFSVVGSVTGSETCLRIPPEGDPVCHDAPASDQTLTVQLADLGPVLAGVTGVDVFRVTAERADGRTSTVLPAPIGDSDVRGFAFTFGIDEVQRLTMYDVHGTQLQTIHPGA